MRIALLCLDPGAPLGGPKGCSTHLRAVAAALLRAGHAVDALVASPGDPDDAAPLRARGLGIHALPTGLEVAALAGRLRSLDPGLVIERLALMAPQGAEAASRLGLPHVYEVNAPLDEEAARHRGFDAGDAARAAFRQGFRASGGAIAVSEPVATWVRGLAPRDYPVAVVPNGAGPAFFERPDAGRVARLRADLGGEGVFLVGFVGSFRPWHDLPTVVDALAHVARRRPARLLLVGDGPQRGDILARAETAKLALTHRAAVPHDEVPLHLAACDAVVVPYASGDAYFSPLKLVEALAVGRPVVASATGPCRQRIQDGRNGILVPPGDAPALARALDRLAEDPRRAERLAAAARASVARGHRWDDVVARVLEFGLRIAPAAPAAERTS